MQSSVPNNPIMDSFTEMIMDELGNVSILVG